MKSYRFQNVFLVAVVAAFFAAPTLAGDTLADAQRPRLPTVSLLDVLDSVSRDTGQVFAIDRNVRPGVVVGQLKTKGMTYDALLLVLRNNALAAYRTGNIVNIIPVATIRQAPLPLLANDSSAVHDEEWVTQIIKLENTSAAHFVPILRPLLPQQGHLVAHKGSNSMMIADRYGNVRRIIAIVSAMDHQAVPREPK